MLKGTCLKKSDKSKKPSQRQKVEVHSCIFDEGPGADGDLALKI